MGDTWSGTGGLAESPFATEERRPATEAGAGELESAKQRRRTTCEAAWSTLRDGLPEPMRDALRAGQFPDAVRWGIHHGMRDVDALTTIVFHGWHGSSRGYCKLDPAEPKFAFYRTQWRQIRDQMVRPAFAFAAQPDKAGPSVCVAGGKPRREPPRPDGPPFDVTGRYEDRAAVPKFTLRVNQAGNHVEALMTEAVLPPSDPRGPRRGPRRTWRFSGDLRPGAGGGYVELFDRARPSVPVHLTPDPATGALRIWESGTPGFRAERVSLAPTMMEGALSGLDEKDLVRLHEWRPLAGHQVRHLHDRLRPDALAPLLQKVFAVKGDLTASRLDRARATGELLRHLERIWDDPAHGIDEQDRDLARFYARTILTRGKWTLGYTRSVLDWLQFATERLVLDGAAPTSAFALTRLLGLAPLARTPGRGMHSYTVRMSMRGGSAFVGGYGGSLTVEKTSDGGAWRKGATERFDFWVLGVEVGIGLKPGKSISGTVSVPFEWQPPDFPGTIAIVKGEVSFGGVSAEAGFVHIHGSGNLPVLEVLFTDLGPDITLKPKPGGAKLDLKLSLGPAGHLGKIRKKPFPDVDYTTFTVRTDHAVAYGLTKDVHFCLDSASLSAEARQAVRVMCANELAAFVSPNTHLTINAHTDRSASPDYNRTLSALRAENTRQVIQDVLGPKFGIAEGNVTLRGMGESEATAAGRPDGERNPKYRRVDVILDARLVLTLNAQ